MLFLRYDASWFREKLVNVNLGKCKEFSTPVKQIINDKYLSGQKYTEIGRDLKIPRNIIYSLIQRYFARGKKRGLQEVAEKEKWTTEKLTNW